MSNPATSPTNPPRKDDDHSTGLVENQAFGDEIDKRLDEIEMIGEERAAGMTIPGSDITPGLRYLHCSRTIHQLVTDRNRAVGIYVAVASLLWTASSALLNASPTGKLMVPIEMIQRWCLPATFAVMTLLAGFVAFLLIRTRVGLIYEVAKMNVLLGLPIGRVKRINPLSIFFIMHLLVSVSGGVSAGLFILHLLYQPDGAGIGTISLCILTSILVTAALVVLYVGMVRFTTSEQKLEDVQKR